MFLPEDVSIGWRNPIEFVSQWRYNPLKEKVRACFIWCLWIWKRSDCNVWIKYGIRILGIEIEYTLYV